MHEVNTRLLEFSVVAYRAFRIAMRRDLSLEVIS